MCVTHVFYYFIIYFIKIYVESKVWFWKFNYWY